MQLASSKAQRTSSPAKNAVRAGETDRHDGVFHRSTRGWLAAASLSTLALLPMTVGAEEVKGDPEAAKAKVSMCIGCHQIGGYRSSYPSVYRVPMIMGQAQGYLVSALKAYRRGDRSHPTMTGIAAGLSDQDIADLAAYYSAAGQ